VRVYHSGDSDAIPEMQALKVDVALMPCGGTYTMTAAEMGRRATASSRQVLIPMHWATSSNRRPTRNRQKGVLGTTVIKTPERGF